jgi:hypothetical protein
MKELKEMALCVTPFIVSALLVYPLMAIVGGNFDPFMWDRIDRAFYFLCVVVFGSMLLARVMVVHEEKAWKL